MKFLELLKPKLDNNHQTNLVFKINFKPCYCILLFYRLDEARCTKVDDTGEDTLTFLFIIA